MKARRQSLGLCRACFGLQCKACGESGKEATRRRLLAEGNDAVDSQSESCAGCTLPAEACICWLAEQIEGECTI